MEIFTPVLDSINMMIGFFNLIVTVFNLMPPTLGILILFGIGIFVLNFVLDFIS